MAVTYTATVEDRWIANGKRHARVKLTTPASSQTITAGGDAIPAFGAMGMKRNLEYIIITDASMADGFILKYDQLNQKIKVFQGDNPNAAAAPAVEATGVAFNSKTLYCEVVGF